MHAHMELKKERADMAQATRVTDIAKDERGLRIERGDQNATPGFA
jgi:hypothetical protein